MKNREKKLKFVTSNIFFVTDKEYKKRKKVLVLGFLFIRNTRHRFKNSLQEM